MLTTTKCGLVFGGVMVGAVFLAVRPKLPASDAVRSAECTAGLERLMVDVSDTRSTLIFFCRLFPPPWKEGNYLSIDLHQAPGLGKTGNVET